LTVVFNHIDSFGNTSIEFISASGTNYPSETNTTFRIIIVEFQVISSFLKFINIYEKQIEIEIKIYIYIYIYYKKNNKLIFFFFFYLNKNKINKIFF